MQITLKESLEYQFLKKNYNPEWIWITLMEESSRT
jgi:hypothetical protein